MRFQLANLQGVGRRERQEDSFVIVNAVDEEKIRDQGLFFAVCDGMGGMADGALASQTAVAYLRDSFRRMDCSYDLSRQLRDSIFEASSKIESVIGGDGGSTVVAGIIFEDSLHFASVGDSFLWLFRDGSLYRLNREMNVCHQHYMEEIRDGGADPYDYQDRKEAHALTGFLGMTGLDDVDCSFRPIPLYENDIILACSDGISGVILENDLKPVLSLPSEQEICMHLEQMLVDYASPNQDNYTAIVIRCCKNKKGKK